VLWPTRKELVTYTTVAVVFCIVVIAIVTSLDYGFTKLMFAVFG
jgi:preprotein translocase subunit SecE